MKLCIFQFVPVVAGMATAASVWFSGSGDLAVGRWQRLDNSCSLLSQYSSTTSAACCCSSSTEKSRE